VRSERAKEAIMVMRVKQIMSSPVVAVAPGTPVKEVAATLVARGVSAVPVVRADGSLAGIVSEGDLVPLQAMPEPGGRFGRVERLLDFLPRTAADAMTRRVVTISEDADAASAARLMLEHAVRSLPVVRDGRMTGIVSRKDLLRVLARSDTALRAEVEELLEDRNLLLGGAVEVAVSGGIVRLCGPRDPVTRRLAGVLARSVPGVVGVSFADRR
jgi:CBS domain-containing protein